MAVSFSKAALDRTTEIGVVGAGTMGAGIAQVAALAGHRVRLFDMQAGAAVRATASIAASIDKLLAKNRITPQHASEARSAVYPVDSLDQLRHCSLIIEAIVEDLGAKRSLFRDLERFITDQAVLATNTSSLSITAIAAELRVPERLAGMHFFNPAPLMALVEVVGGVATSPNVLQSLKATAKRWGKSPVLARSTPGFIVNRVARSFYAEALRLLDEGAADCATIDAIMRDAGGFRMGPFQLMDLIGHDVNYAVTRSVFEAFYGDPRFTPSLRQKELIDAGYLGRKTGRGFYSYAPDASPAEPLVCNPAPAPERVRIFGDGSLARALARRLSNTSIRLQREPSTPDGRIAETEHFTLYVTDGRTATQGAADLGKPNLVLVDTASDYLNAKRLAITSADQASSSALPEAAGLFQAAGYLVSPIDDAPGLIVMRTVAMLANEAADAVQQHVCSAEDCDLAMRLGVNYPRGPLEWAEILGLPNIVTVLDNLGKVYREGRYRVSPLLRRKALAGLTFHKLDHLHRSTTE